MQKGREKIQKIEYLGIKKRFWDEIKRLFHSFEGLSFVKKKANKFFFHKKKQLPEILRFLEYLAY